jgi:GntR family transcriptional regulator, transcriptional repressor for pyruvate dehydrogenase complex
MTLTARLEQLVEAGGRLPSERHLAAELSVSRATLREALHELELKGLIERVPGRGTTVVARPDGTTITDALLARPTDEERRIGELMDFRLAIEPVIARRAAQYATRDEVDELGRVCDEMAAARSPQRFRELDERFHWLIARATHNTMFASFVQGAEEALRETRVRQRLSPPRRAASLEGHREIVAAVAARDPAGAEDAMRRHVLHVARELGVPAA